MDASVQELLDLEWRLFDAAPQAGQRSAQFEDREQFIITRSAQLAAWSPELLESWWQDLRSAQAEGRNSINEKYIYMLEQVDPERYAMLKPGVPEASMEKLWLVDWICQAQVTWQETLQKKYPGITQNSRAIHRSADNQDSVSFETFVRSELMTYSVSTLRLYARQIEKAQKVGENLCETILENTVRQLGFDSLETANSNMIRAGHQDE
nr:DUF4125 family protein [uncultured Oscillibacter sp.]